MPELHDALASRVADWRDAGYPHADFPAIAEILHEAWFADVLAKLAEMLNAGAWSGFRRP